MASDTTAAILGTGSYVPERRLTNADLEKTLNTSDEWITTRTGIKERRIAADGEVTSDMCLKAAQLALEDARLKAEDLDLIIIATLTPDHPMPSTGCILQQKLGLGEKSIPGFDLNAACSGYLYALSCAKAHVEAGMAKTVLVVGAEALSRIVDYQDRGTCILFGDGAGSAVVGLPREGRPAHRIKAVNLWADGRGGEQLIIPAGGAKQPASHVSVDERLHYVRVNGREVFRFGVTKMVEMIQRLMSEHDLKPEDIGLIVPHQANIRILDSATERLGLPPELFFTNLEQYGNTSGASVPLALDEAARQGRIPQGKAVLLLGFGAGLTWASALLEW